VAVLEWVTTKLNLFSNCDVRAMNTTKSGVLSTGSVNQLPPSGASANGLAGHRVNNNHWDYGFGHVFTPTHDPIKVKGMIFTPPPPSPPSPKSPSNVDFTSELEASRYSSSFGQGSRIPMGKLPKVNFPKFDGENQKLWQSHCESYFEILC
jgi:hypothetical protein